VAWWWRFVGGGGGAGSKAACVRLAGEPSRTKQVPSVSSTSSVDTERTKPSLERNSVLDPRAQT